MTKTLTALAAASAVALATLAVPTTADARCVGCAVGAGIIGGIAAGAIIGGALSQPAPPPAYYGPPPAGYAPGRYWHAVACANGPGWWAPGEFQDRYGYMHERNFFYCP